MHAVAQAWDAGKLFHIDLNDQAFGRYDQDLRFGSHSIKSCFFLVKFLEDVKLPWHAPLRLARLPHRGPARASRTSPAARMRSYLIYKEKARRWNEDKEIQALVREISNVPTDGLPTGRRVQQGHGRRAQGPHLRPQGPGRPRPRLREARPAHARSAPGRPLRPTRCLVGAFSHPGRRTLTISPAVLPPARIALEESNLAVQPPPQIEDRARRSRRKGPRPAGGSRGSLIRFEWLGLWRESRVGTWSSE